MVQQGKALTALAEDPHSVPRIHTELLTIAITSSRVSNIFSFYQKLHSCAHTHTQTETYT